MYRVWLGAAQSWSIQRSLPQQPGLACVELNAKWKSCSPLPRPAAVFEDLPVEKCIYGARAVITDGEGTMKRLYLSKRRKIRGIQRRDAETNGSKSLHNCMLSPLYWLVVLLCFMPILVAPDATELEQ